jgi:hypothetical protein
MFDRSIFDGFAELLDAAVSRGAAVTSADADEIAALMH